MADRYDHETLLAYVEGELNDEARARFEAQLQADAELRRLVEGMVHDRNALHDLPREAPPPALVDDAIQQLERQMLLGAPSDEPIPIEPAKRPPRRHRVFKTLAYSGIAAIMLLSGGLILYTLTGTNAIETAQRIVQLDRGNETSLSEPAPERPSTSLGDVALNDSPTPLADRDRLRFDAESGEMEGRAQSADESDGLAAPERLTLSLDQPTTDAGEFQWGGRDWFARMLETSETAATPTPLAGDADAVAEGGTLAAAPMAEGLTLRSRAMQEPALGGRGEAASAMKAPAIAARREALSSSAAAWQVQVVSEDVGRTHAQVTDWAVRRGAAIQPMAAFTPPAARATVRMRVEPSHLPDLLQTLNDSPGQRVMLSVDERVAVSQLPSPIPWDALVGRPGLVAPLRQPKATAEQRVAVDVVITLDADESTDEPLP